MEKFIFSQWKLEYNILKSPSSSFFAQGFNFIEDTDAPSVVNTLVVYTVGANTSAPSCNEQTFSLVLPENTYH